MRYTVASVVSLLVVFVLILGLSGCESTTDKPGDTTRGTTTQNGETTAQRSYQEKTTAPSVVVTEETTSVEVIQYSSDKLPETGGLRL